MVNGCLNDISFIKYSNCISFHYLIKIVSIAYMQIISAAIPVLP